MKVGRKNVVRTRGKTLSFAQRYETFKKHFKRDWRLYVLLIVPTLHWIIFKYGPMYGVQIAFRNYTPAKGILGSEWVGFKWFKDFLSDPMFNRIFKNTVALSLYSLLTFPFPIILALVFNAIRSKRYVKVVQTVSYMPHFISTVVFVGIIDMILSPVYGLYGSLYRLFGGNNYPVDFSGAAAAFRHIYIWSGVWQGVGWGTILYTSALAGVSTELHEAARIDGASRFKRILHVDIPAIMPTVAIMLIMRVGSLISVGFEKTYLMQTSLNLQVSEVIATYTYKKGMKSFNGFSYGSSIELFNNVINVTLMLIANWISKKVSEDEVSLF